jgi:DNA repair exonuclease SbcCD nuclease subunit
MDERKGGNVKITFTGDLHLSGFVSDLTDSTNDLPERLSEKKRVLYNIIEEMKKRGSNYLVIAGDLLHNKSVIYSLAQSVMLDFIRENKDIYFTVIDGNHDLSGKGKKIVSALKCLDSEPNVKRVQFDRVVWEDDIVFIPYSMNVVKEVKENSANILVSHFGLNEAVLNCGASIVSDIALRDLSDRYNFAFLGHYHTPQEIIRENIKLYYMGSITQTDWSEKNENKRFLVFDTETGEVESILTKGYKKRYELLITNENKEEVIKQARDFKANGDYVILKKTEKVETSDISKEFAVVDKTEKTLSSRGISMSMADRDKVVRYLEVSEVPQEDREWITGEALDIIQSCAGQV